MVDLGMRLFLMIGETIPTPAPYAIMSSFVDLEVTNKDRERDGFQMKFTLGKGSMLDYDLLREGYFNPLNRVIISVVLNVTPQVLIDGVITHHQMMPSNQPGKSELVVTGEAVSLMLDREEKSETYPNQSDSTIVTRLLANYASYGLVPKITSTSDVPVETDRIPSQQGTDLKFIQELAERNGFVFYIEPTAVPSVNTAYWGVENRLGNPQPALSMNMGPDTNVDAPINFTYNALGPAAPQVTIIEPISKTPISIPIPSGLLPSLSSQPASALRQTIDRNSANLSPIQAGLRALVATTDSSDAVSANGEVDTVRYGHVLQSRRLVGIRGVGKDFNGVYYVKEVRHQIKIGQYKQSFSLTRDGLGASSPRLNV
jgi:hypothetical protein